MELFHSLTFISDYVLNENIYNKCMIFTIYMNKRKIKEIIEKKDIKRHIWEGPLDFKSRIVKTFPENTKDIDRIISLYINLRYGSIIPTKQLLKQLKLSIGRLRI